MATNVVRDLKRGGANPIAQGSGGTPETAAMIERLCSRLSAVERSIAPEPDQPSGTEAVIVNMATKCRHKILVSHTGVSSNRTICGWCYSDDQVFLITEDANDFFDCDTCFGITFSSESDS